MVFFKVTPANAIHKQDQASADAPHPLSITDVVASCHDSLVSFLRQRLRIADDALDVAQEAYIKLTKYEGSLEVKSPRSLLFHIAINVANDLGRADKVRRGSDHCDIDLLDLDSETPGPEREVAAAQDLDLLYRTIEELPRKCRNVFLLSRVNHMTYQQIADHCGISVKMVEKHISKALSHCMSRVGQ